MHFSVLMPRPGHERAAVHQRMNDDAYGDHQWLWRLFPAAPGTPRDFLFRRQELNGLPRYHLVSARAPADAGGAWQVQTRDYAPALKAGDRLLFDLRACPTVRHSRNGKSRRHDVVMEAKKRLLAERGLVRWDEWHTPDKPPLYALVQEACTHWLDRRGEASGFELDKASCLASAYQQFEFTGKKDAVSKPMFSSVELSGELTVTEPEAFKQALFRGIGSAKAFGCGLLMVRRAI